MILATALLTHLALAVVPAPLGDARVTVQVDRLSDALGVAAFLESAGRRSALLRPQAWGLTPLLHLDLQERSTFAATGVDFGGGYTRTSRRGTDASCVRAADPRKLEAAARAALADQAGPPVRRIEREGGVILSASDEDGKHSGLVLRGAIACLVETSGGDPARTFDEVFERVGGGRSRELEALTSLPGVVRMGTRQVRFGVEATRTTLVAEGTARLRELPRVVAKGNTPYAATAEGLVHVRAHLEPSGRRRSLAQLLGRVEALCGGCGLDAEALAAALDASASGHFLYRLHDLELRPRTRLRNRTARFMALRQVLLIDLARPAAVRAHLASLGGQWKRAAGGERATLALGEGELAVGLRGRQLYLANDPGALEAALALVGGQAPPLEHGLELTADGPGLRRALNRIPALEAVAAPGLAMAYAVSLEVGAVLGVTDQLSAWVDSTAPGAQKFRVSWKLKPAP